MSIMGIGLLSCIESVLFVVSFIVYNITYTCTCTLAVSNLLCACVCVCVCRPVVSLEAESPDC